MANLFEPAGSTPRAPGRSTCSATSSAIPRSSARSARTSPIRASGTGARQRRVSEACVNRCRERISGISSTKWVYGGRVSALQFPLDGRSRRGEAFNVSLVLSESGSSAATPFFRMPVDVRLGQGSRDTTFRVTPLAPRARRSHSPSPSSPPRSRSIPTCGYSGTSSPGNATPCMRTRSRRTTRIPSTGRRRSTFLAPPQVGRHRRRLRRARP